MPATTISDEIAQHAGQIRKFCAAQFKTFSEDALDELVQTTLERAIRYSGSFKGDSALDTWLYRIARNTGITMAGKRQDYLSRVVTSSESLFESRAYSGQIDLDEMSLSLALDSLSEEDRSVIDYYLVGGMMFLCAMLGLKKAAAEMRLNIVRGRLANLAGIEV